MIVVDTNLIAYLLIQGIHTDQASAVLRKDPDWVAPLLWRSEFRNVLSNYLHRGELSLANALRLMEEAESLMRGGEYEVPSSLVLDLTSKSGCSAYDCEFVGLAREMNAPLVTSDARILREFPSFATSLDAFLA